MADGETAGGDEEGCEVLNDAPSTQPGPNVVSQVTTVTKNINIGQEVNVNGSQNIIIMTGNALHVMQQNSQCESVGHTVTQPSQSPPPPRHNTTSCNNNSSCDIDVPGLQLQMSRVRYADGEC
jgi:hypothetical protein